MELKEGSVRIASWRVSCGATYAMLEKPLIKLSIKPFVKAESPAVNVEISFVRTNRLAMSLGRLSE